ncbi:hypothetical protein E2C01_034814 [Portunus trituberculatus]|uniref:Uncharacterized protein n=1 Tax=Portunus trituberculatus TaxID=210409 RepID=A0A5B7F6Q0_PORTR|nr:hypothetical protein [Portunus trituberculatus]
MRPHRSHLHTQPSCPLITWKRIINHPQTDSAASKQWEALPGRLVALHCPAVLLFPPGTMLASQWLRAARRGFCRLVNREHRGVASCWESPFVSFVGKIKTLVSRCEFQAEREREALFHGKEERPVPVIPYIKI